METTVTLKLYAGLRKFIPESADNHPIQSGITVQELMISLGIPSEKPLLIFVAGNRSTLSAKLEGGEIIKVFPPMRGG
ncbi:MoaD/ThiS family protein [bacterium]|nr:MoaD/ThiS family protein [bacterium]